MPDSHDRTYWEDKAKELQHTLLTPENIARFETERRAKMWPDYERVNRALAASLARARTTTVWA